MNYCKSETFSGQLVEVTFLKTGSPQSQRIRTLLKWSTAFIVIESCNFAKVFSKYP